MSKKFDVIVVGSGLVGGYAAKCFTQRGQEVLVLESGTLLSKKMLKAAEHSAGESFESRFPERASTDENFVALHHGPYDTWGEDARKLDALLHDDRDFKNKGDTIFSFVHFDVVGGRSLMWGRVTPRLARHDFNASSLDGHGIDWPISYTDLAPYYDKVEAYVGIRGGNVDHAEMPLGRYNQGGNWYGKVLESMNDIQLEGGYTVKVLEMPSATLSKPHLGRNVVSESSYGKVYDNIHPDHYNSVHGALKDAEATGLLTLLDEKMVTKVLLDQSQTRAIGVEAIDRQSKALHHYEADVVFLCASTIYSTKIFLNSKTSKHPNGLGNHSDHLGRYLMDHMLMPGASGFIALDKATYDHPDQHGASMIPRFVNLGGDKDQEFIRSFQYQCFTTPVRYYKNTPENPYVFCQLDQSKIGDGGMRIIITSNTEEIAEREDQEVQYGVLVTMLGFGGMLSDPKNRVTLSKEVDHYGIPKVEVEAGYCENDKRIVEASSYFGKAILKQLGAQNIKSDLGFKPHLSQAPMVGLGIHEMGTARMGNMPENSVLNPHNQVWGVENVYCTDGACMSSSGVANPSLTYMALTERAVEYACQHQLDTVEGRKAV